MTHTKFSNEEKILKKYGFFKVDTSGLWYNPTKEISVRENELFFDLPQNIRGY